LGPRIIFTNELKSPSAYRFGDALLGSNIGFSGVIEAYGIRRFGDRKKWADEHASAPAIKSAPSLEAKLGAEESQEFILRSLRLGFC
jgi:hypothetical protein